MQGFLFVFWLALMVLALWRLPMFRLPGFDRRTVPMLFILKCAAGAALIAIYTFYYTDRKTADIYKFFDDAAVIAHQLPEHPERYVNLVFGLQQEPEVEQLLSNWAPHSEQWLRFSQTTNSNLFNSNRIVTRIHALLFPLTGGFILTHLLFFNLFVVAALCSLSRALIAKGLFSNIGLLSLWCMPSVLFWCSGLLKDSLVLAGLSLVFAEVINTQHTLAKRLVVGIPAFLLVLLTKYYIVAALVPALMFLWFLELKPKLKIASFILLIIILLGSFYAGYTENLVHMLWAKREEALKSAVLGEARSMAFYTPVESWSQFGAEVLPSLWRGLVGPLGDTSGGGPFVWMAAVESIVLLLGLGLFLLPGAPEISRFAWSLIVFTLLLAIIVGFTTPVTGGLLRYKTAYLPFLMYAFSERIKVGRIKGFLTRSLRR